MSILMRWFQTWPRVSITSYQIISVNQISSAHFFVPSEQIAIVNRKPGNHTVGDALAKCNIERIKRRALRSAFRKSVTVLTTRGRKNFFR